MTRFAKTVMPAVLALLAALGLAGAAQAAPSAPPPAPPAVPVPGDLAATEVSFAGSGLTLHGTVLAPRNRRGALPGMVLVHGAGAGTPRTKLMTEAVEFARRGMAVLVYDKRAAGYSTFRRSYSQLADDALGAVAALRRQTGVDPGKVGLWGLSEGGWVVPLAASRSRDVAFVVLVGANSLEPLRQQSWAVMAGLRKAGVSGSLPGRAVPTLYRAISAGGLFPEPWHDPLSVLRAVRQPVLAIWGTHDLLTPPRESPPLMARALAEGGNEHVTLRLFPGAEHAAHLTSDGGVTRRPELAPGYADLVGSWVSDVATGRAPRTSPPPGAPRAHQASATVAVPPPAWWESAPVQTAALLLFLTAFLGYPLTAAARRIRGLATASGARGSREGASGRPGAAASGTGRPGAAASGAGGSGAEESGAKGAGARWAGAGGSGARRAGAAPRVLAASGLVVVIGGFAYLTYVIMTGGKLAQPGPVLAGRPVLWLALQALTVTVAVTTVLTARAWRAAERRAERVRLGLLVTAGAVMIPWALYWGLLLP
ncbi:prolyl oligopeptidase family serine peptidase [Nonomuraea sp. NPDC003804]|uniref:alpha/beta hydrolase n=1 Tax=Nonomuraea sp. NPDC003804 TaxID=3154547 RepID=UPI00339E695E